MELDPHKPNFQTELLQRNKDDSVDLRKVSPLSLLLWSKVEINITQALD